MQLCGKEIEQMLSVLTFQLCIWIIFWWDIYLLVFDVECKLVVVVHTGRKFKVLGMGTDTLLGKPRHLIYSLTR